MLKQIRKLSQVTKLEKVCCVCLQMFCCSAFVWDYWLFPLLLWTKTYLYPISFFLPIGQSLNLLLSSSHWSFVHKKLGWGTLQLLNLVLFPLLKLIIITASLFPLLSTNRACLSLPSLSLFLFCVLPSLFSYIFTVSMGHSINQSKHPINFPEEKAELTPAS